MVLQIDFITTTDDILIEKIIFLQNLKIYLNMILVILYKFDEILLKSSRIFESEIADQPKYSPTKPPKL